MSKYAILVSLLAASTLGAGAFAWQTKKTVDSRDHDVQSLEAQVSELTKARDAERDAKDKASAESTAALTASRAELDELRAEHQEAEKRLEAFKALTEKFRKMIDSGKLEVALRHGRMVVKLPAGVLFASGSADLSKEGKDALKEVTGILRHISDRRFMVAGHTDNVPVGTPSPFKNNLDLSTSRALIVAQHMIASGMPPARLVAAGYSEYEPVRENSNEAGRKENRRIEIVLMPHVTELPAMPGDKADAGAPVAKTDAPKADADAGTTTTAKK
ncbi:Flagellar motor rotation protein MotB [Labilithrix luteola]|uniref:Flagellar motor rotation protein MotB n=1 Tax=Labilithrix luteola TaxID=1391654 RepID=A0A0K1PRV3_9BACT|nr:OmpA family protein [Labilithrix luteola]AKU95854.1 Flagellar motor rotation protein MotB [Labilithrix luteola]